MGPGGEEEPKSIEDLKAAQDAHTAEVSARKVQEEAKAQHQRELEMQAQGEYAEGGRQDVLDEIHKIRAEADQMEAEHIRERKAQAEKLRGDAAEKKEALGVLQTEILSAKERVQEIGDIIKGVSEDEVASEVKESYDAAQKEHLALIAQAQYLDGEISQLEDQIPSSELVQKYEGLLTKLSELDTHMAEIESNPALIELIMKEAKSEDEMRDRVVHAALAEAIKHGYGKARREDPRVRELGEKITQTFISEVMADHKLSEIKDPAERQRNMHIILREMFEGVTSGHKSFGFEGIARERDVGKQHNMYNGLVLLNLLGGYGTLGGTLGFLRCAEKGVRLGGIEDHTQDHIYNFRAVVKHLNTLNLIRAYSFSLKGHDHLEQFVPGFVRWQNDFDMQVTSGGKNGMDAREGQPIIPRSASEEEKARITERFEAEKKKAERLEEALKNEEEQKKQEAIKKIEDEIQKINAGIKVCEEAQRINKDKPIEHRDLEEREKGLESLRQEQGQLEKDIQRYQGELSILGFFARGEKRDLREKINQKSTRLNFIKTNLSRFEEEAEKFREALTFMNSYRASSTYEITRKRDELVYALKRINRGN